MTKNVGGTAFILLLIGTFGLLLNEFVFTWGRTGTLIFAVANIVGLVILGFSYWRKKQG